ncbi:MAG: TonB-dependent receptor plug domain-containing protein, partial [Ignavibacteriae bacterium]|nr:TonB-dependent receptor plug domain-containing protein [Ignavibacteriota bacterium]
SDLTTELDFNLSAEAVALTGIEIIAERPLVNKSATNAVRVVSGDELAAIPVRGVAAVVALQAGVVLYGGQLFIRGGRQDEVGYYVDGADARDARTGDLAISIVPEALEEFQVQAGGYNAEYGGANAGIVRQQLRTGSSDYKASLRVESDNFVSRGEKFLGGYSYGYSDYSATFGGPIVSDKIKFFIAGQNTFQADPAVVFWDGATFNGLAEDLAGSNPDPNRNNVPDTINLVVPAGNVPGNKLESWAGNGTVTFDYNPIIVRLSGSLNYQKSKFNPTPIRNILNQQRTPDLNTSSGLYSAKITHFLEATTFYDITLGYQDQRAKRFDPIFEDDYLAYGDSTANAAKGILFFGRFKSPQDLRTNGFPFSRPGSLNTAGGVVPTYQKRKQNYISGALDITHQLKGHELKGGFNYQRYTMRNYTLGRMEALYGSLLSNPDAARMGGADLDLLFRIGGLPNNYGYDIYGNEIDGGFDGPKHPTYISAYLQDKFEFNDLVVNFGLRFDSFDNDDRIFIDDPTTPNIVEGPRNPSYDPANFTVRESGTQKVKAFKTVSPRLGFSFPVTDRTVFHVQYGKFVQPPQLNAIYASPSQQALNFSGRNFIPLPWGTGLEPERTTQYEIGFTQQFTDFASFDLTTFYKDIQGQILIDKITTTTGSQAASYNILKNGDYATTKGFEFTLRIRRVERVQAAINYTLSDAQGTGSSLNTAVSAVEAGPIRPTIISPLTFNQTHRGTINIDYRFGKDDGGQILERLGANLLFSFNSGHNYTKSQANSGAGQRGPEEGGILADDDPRPRRPEGAINSATTPWVFTVDMRLDKTVSIADMFDVNFYIYVQNLLNTQNVLNVYSRSGNAYDDGFLTNPALSASIIAGQGPQYVELYQFINLKNRQHYWQNQLNGVNALQGGDLFGTPRQVRFGLSIVY